MIGPHDTQQKGNSKEQYDGMPEAGHREQFNHANSGRSSESDHSAENREAKNESMKDN